jgi:hypothetical protein
LNLVLSHDGSPRKRIAFRLADFAFHFDGSSKLQPAQSITGTVDAAMA